MANGEMANGKSDALCNCTRKFARAGEILKDGKAEYTGRNHPKHEPLISADNR
jgi:hypothetical protein